MKMAQSSVDSDRLSSAGISTHSSGTAGTVGGSVVGVRVGEPGLKREDEDEYNLGPLPPMWEKAFTPSGEVYFIDHNSGTSHWLDPRLARVRKHSLGECGEDELPFGWERVTDERYGSYYVDHINRRTQYENPVLQARRLRDEKLATENGGSTTPNGQPPTGELRGDRFTLTLTKGPQGLGFTLIGAEGVPEMEGYLQIRSIVPHSPAWMDGGLRAGDVLVGVGGRGTRGMPHAHVATMFQNIPAGGDVTLHLVRGYPLSLASADPHARVLSTLAVDNSHAGLAAPAPTNMQHLTTALRTRFNLESPVHGADTDADTQSGPPAPPPPRARCASADALAHNDTVDGMTSAGAGSGGGGCELSVSLRRGAAGFGFTVADSVHGQKVKKVLDRGRCAGLREGDVLLSIGDVDVSRAKHHTVVQVLKECPALHETTLRVWRRSSPAARAPRSRSATRVPVNATVNNNASRSKTPTAEQLRGPSLYTRDSLHDDLHDDLHDNLHDNLHGDLHHASDADRVEVEATYAVPEHKRERESLMERRRRSSTPGGRLTLPAAAWGEWGAVSGGAGGGPGSGGGAAAPAHWENGDRWSENWGSVATPTVHVDLTAAYWPLDGPRPDSSENGFPEDGLLHSPGMSLNNNNRMRTHSPNNSTDRLGSGSPSAASGTERLLAGSPGGSAGGSVGGRLHTQSPSNHSSGGRVKGSPMRGGASPPGHVHARYDDVTHNYAHNYPQVSVCSAGGPGADRLADVVVRLGRGAAGFGFRIVGGTEDGTSLAVGHVLPGGPADGLLRAGDLLTSVDGQSLLGATHARAVAAVCQAAARGHVTLGIRHNRADVHAHIHPHTLDPSSPLVQQTSYNIVHPAPLYPHHAANVANVYGAPYSAGGWPGDVYDVTLTRNDGEGFGFVVISSTNKATSTIGQLIPGSPAARCGRLRVGDTIVAINRAPIRNLAHPEVVALIKRSGAAVLLTVAPNVAPPTHAHVHN